MITKLNDIIEINTLCNTSLRRDQIAYILGHVELITDVDGKEKKVLATIGKKSKRLMPEGFFPICLHSRVEFNGVDDNNYYFQTRAANSTAKSPKGMFPTFEIPNSLALVDAKVREFYKL